MKKIVLLSFLVAAFILMTGLSACPGKDEGSTTTPIAGVHKSDDSGLHWNPVNYIDDQHSLDAVNIMDIAIDGNNHKTIYVGTLEYGVFKSEDGGETWQSVSLNSGDIYAVVVDQRNGSIVYAGGIFNEWGKIYKSIDGGNNWEEVYVETVKDRTITELAIDGYDTRRIYAGNEEGGLLKSMDGGKSWVVINWFDKEITAITISPLDTRIIFVGTNGEGLYRTLNSGIDWESMQERLEDIEDSKLARKVHSVAIDPQVKDTVYFGSPFGLLKSPDNGDSWQPIEVLAKPGEHSILSIALDPTSSNTIYLGLDQTVYKSVDQGVNWTVIHITEGFIKDMILDYKEPNILYSGVTIKD